LRAVSEPDGSHLAETRVELRPAPGYGDPSRGPRTAVTERFGLATFVGLEPQIAVATLRRPRYVERQVSGLSASPASFEFREVALERPGSVRMTISIGGKPGSGARCRIQDFTPSSRYGKRAETPRVLFEGEASQGGVCLAHAIPAGSYSVRILPPPDEAGGDAARLATVSVEPGRESALDVALDSVPLSGSVVRGADPAVGYRVRIASPNADRTEEEVVTLATGEDGEYRATLWTEGEYFVSLFTPAGRLVESKRALVAGSESRCDFRLSPHSIHGVVKDEAGRAAAEAAVLVSWSRAAQAISPSFRRPANRRTARPGGSSPMPRAASRCRSRRGMEPPS
jgi:hypothetical protein